MPDYWLDSNVFIEGMKGPYGFDIAPRFWELIDEMIEVGRIACPTRVLRELLDGQDDLSTWARERRNSGLFIAAEPAVQEASARVIQFAVIRYPDNQARRRFLDRADPWVIAHAGVDGGTVVTSEVRVPRTRVRSKFPTCAISYKYQSDQSTFTKCCASWALLGDDATTRWVYAGLFAPGLPSPLVFLDTISATGLPFDRLVISVELGCVPEHGAESPSEHAR